MFGFGLQVDRISVDIDGVERARDIPIFMFAEFVQTISRIRFGFPVGHLKQFLPDLPLPLSQSYLQHANNETLIFINKVIQLPATIYTHHLTCRNIIIT